MRQLRSFGLIIIIVGFTACAASPEDVYQDALQAGQDAAKGKDRTSVADGLLEDYLLYFTTSSAELLRSASQVSTRQSEFKYVPDVRKILPKAKATKVEVRGNLAILSMKADHGAFTLYMIQHKGNWVIDLFSLKKFWGPLANTEGG